MSFDSKAFLQTQFQPRTKDVRVPELGRFFPGGEPVWTVRSLTAAEIARAREANEKRNVANALTEALTEPGQSEKVRAIRNVLGHGDEVPNDVCYRHELLALGSVDPKCPMDLAVRLAENFAVVFYLLTNTILELTNQGAETAEKKPAPSGKIPKSAPVSS